MQWAADGIVSRLYAIVDADVLAAKGMSLEAVAAELAGARVRVVQYRNKRGGAQEVLAAASLLKKVLEPAGCLLVMNDRVDLAVLAGLGGVHVGQGDLSPEDVKRVGGGWEQGIGKRLEGREGRVVSVVETERAVALARDTPPYRDKAAKRWGTQGFSYCGFLVGISTHTEEQVLAAAAGVADYVAIGPVFATGTKADAAAVVGLEGVRMARALTAKPLVAIGGITLTNCRSVIEAGADMVAVISGLFVEGRSVGDTARDFLEVLR